MTESQSNTTSSDPPAETIETPDLIEPPPSGPLHVAWIAGPETTDRLGRTLQPLAIGLLDELIRLTVFCPEKARLPALPTPPIEVIRYAEPKWWQLTSRSPDRLAQLADIAGVQVLHALDCTTIQLTRKLAQKTGLPYLLSTYKAGAFGPITSKLDTAALGIHTTSQPLQDEVLQRDLIDPQKVHLVRPGVYPVKRPTCFAEPDQDSSIVVGGRLDRTDCFQAVLESMASLREAGHPCACFIIGTGPGESDLRACAEELDLRTEVTFCDPLSATQMAGILKSADMYISPAPSDLVDIQALVAAAAGSTVVASDGHVSDFLIDGTTARVVPPADVRAMTDALLEMITDHAAARKLCSSALEYIREHHSPANMVTAAACLYRGLTSSHDTLAGNVET